MPMCPNGWLSLVLGQLLVCYVATILYGMHELTFQQFVAILGSNSDFVC